MEKKKPQENQLQNKNNRVWLGGLADTVLFHFPHGHTKWLFPTPLAF